MVEQILSVFMVRLYKGHIVDFYFYRSNVSRSATCVFLRSLYVISAENRSTHITGSRFAVNINFNVLFVRVVGGLTKRFENEAKNCWFLLTNRINEGNGFIFSNSFCRKETFRLSLWIIARSHAKFIKKKKNVLSKIDFDR